MVMIRAKRFVLRKRTHIITKFKLMTKSALRPEAVASSNARFCCCCCRRHRYHKKPMMIARNAELNERASECFSFCSSTSKMHKELWININNKIIITKAMENLYAPLCMSYVCSAVCIEHTNSRDLRWAVRADWLLLVLLLRTAWRGRAKKLLR